MTLTITGATGKLGRHVVESLLERGVPAGDIVATGRTTERLADLAERGVAVRRADFDEPDGLAAAFEGVDRLLLISTSNVGTRVAGHRNAIAAASAAGAQLVAYTSIPHADTGRMMLMQDHLATERALADSGLPHVLLRNSWYLENYTGQLPTVMDSHSVFGAADDGVVSAAMRSEFAEAAAAALLLEDPAGQVFELGGEGFTLGQFAAAAGDAIGEPVTYVNLSEAELTSALVAAGVPEGYAAALADADRGLARGELEVTTGHLAQLLGRPATSMPEAVAAEMARMRS